MKTSPYTENYTQWSLPEGAKARLGKGSITGNIAYSPDGTRLVVPSSIGIWIYNAYTLEEVELIAEHKGFDCTAIGFTLSGSMLTSKFVTSVHGFNFYYGKLQIWDEDTRHSKDISIFMKDRGQITSLVFSPDGHTLATGSTNGQICLWDVHTAELRNTFTEHTETISSLVFSPDGHTLAARNKDGIVQLWNVNTGELLTTFKEQIWELVFNPDGSALAAGLGELSFEHPDTQSIGLWNVHAGNYVSTFVTSMISSNLVFSPDGKMLVCAAVDRYDNRSICLWDIATGSSISPSGWLSGHTGSIRYLAFSPDGRTLASGSQDGTVLLWDVDTMGKKNPPSSRVAIPGGAEGCRYHRQKTISVEERAESQDRTSQIQQICQDRGITTLVHFTRIGYLRNILQEGLLDHQTLLKKHGQQFVPNDWRRLDGYKEAICLSISFPNFQLFSKFRYKYSGGNCSEWVVLLLDAKVLWELDCAFCQENAASKAAREILLQKRKEPEALERIFIEVYRDIKIVDGIRKEKIYQRQSMQIPAHYPTHPQAEILVFDQIPSDYIKEVHFYNETALEQWRYSNPRNYPPRFTVKQQYFQYGRDQVVWQDDNLDNDDTSFDSGVSIDDDIPF